MPGAVTQSAGREAQLMQGRQFHTDLPLHDLADDQPGVVVDVEHVLGDGHDVAVGQHRLDDLLLVLERQAVALVERARLGDQLEGGLRGHARHAGVEECDHVVGKAVGIQVHLSLRGWGGWPLEATLQSSLF